VKRAGIQQRLNVAQYGTVSNLRYIRPYSRLTEGKSTMAGALKELIEATKAVKPTPEQREEQRRSFAFGNTAFENSRITREMVDRQADELAKEQNG